MKFVFISHGINNGALAQISALVGKMPEEIRVLFIDTPANTYPPNSPWLIESKEELKNSGFNLTEYDIEEAYKTGDDVEKAVSANDIVAISGGNTFYFLYWAKKVNLKKILKKFLINGGVYMGESAGVVCQIKDLEPIKWMDHPELAPEAVQHGMQLTDLVIIPHYGTLKYKEITKKIKSYYENKGIKPYLLKDGQVIIVNDGDIKRT